ncbi:hypothetical protein A134_23255 [Vibrio crassostreae 9CS106]|uniref:Uncharacterized protein n=1 Tax=Vibrio crassostreae 9CS106 TaxID=1191300 RepID=A0A1B1C3A5_9VIBR|nr:hypothetical protein A134_23255 [Vibrio crassostreae 9CS106]
MLHETYFDVAYLLLAQKSPRSAYQMKKMTGLHRDTFERAFAVLPQNPDLFELEMDKTKLGAEMMNVTDIRVSGREEKRHKSRLLRRVIMASPHLSNQKIADITGYKRGGVRYARKELEDKGMIKYKARDGRITLFDILTMKWGSDAH